MVSVPRRKPRLVCSRCADGGGDCGDLPSAAASIRNLRLPLGYVFPLLAVGGALGVRWYSGNEMSGGVFGFSAFLAGMLTSVVFGVYPMVLPARDPAFSLSVENARRARMV